ncbi:bifunctional phosphopantothenoylcysteine decarboxylase/phosphopantothenate--cysteine ligase CoaBC [Desulfofalx alkaliphila]|uniref:bifunctional phosphopantothenoylcysteine decarboxylase/phosphopantothenate--cysteine ligase CoaBC n=1 Tax=Desulfofalx alkaliphila TaxID=105483 RepID=UPI0004E121EF|nr:bifunctional phosphopantothenoylcysteine decarboxylase/phosphopantothenate--cysteine ligase CoaBC [Desulfofalx alkaliphila]
MLTGRIITVGIAGGIAAYKSAELVSGLVKAKAKVRVIMTEGAQNFIRPMTFSALTGNAVFTDMFADNHGGVTHIELAQNADLLVVAPATANIIGKVANGIADDMLSTVILAASCEVVFCPAMNTVMYKNPVVQQNIKKLRQLGYAFIGPNSGQLACGSTGPGRMSEPHEILHHIKQMFTAGDLEGVKILVSAGPTREPIDPVRYISNRSSGKMGYSIAKAARDRGAKVVLVSGPVNLPPPEGVTVIKVETALQMRRAMLENFPDSDVVIKSAAVADYRPKSVSDKKIKKSHDPMVLAMEKNPDILAELGRMKGNQVLVGFAAETGKLDEYARLKLRQKNLDLLVANDVSVPGAGFDVDTNIVKIFNRNGTVIDLPMMTKEEVAKHILDLVARYRSEQSGE